MTKEENLLKCAYVIKITLIFSVIFYDQIYSKISGVWN